MTRKSVPEVPQGDPAPVTLEQPNDPFTPEGYKRPYPDGAAEPKVNPDDVPPPGTPQVGPTDGPFAEGVVPAGTATPLTAEQAAYLNKKFPPAEEPL